MPREVWIAALAAIIAVAAYFAWRYIRRGGFRDGGVIDTEMPWDDDDIYRRVANFIYATPIDRPGERRVGFPPALAAPYGSEVTSDGRDALFRPPNTHPFTLGTTPYAGPDYFAGDPLNVIVCAPLSVAHHDNPGVGYVLIEFTNPNTEVLAVSERRDSLVDFAVARHLSICMTPLIEGRRCYTETGKGDFDPMGDFVEIIPVTRL